MALAYDAVSSTSGAQIGPGSVTLSHTCSGFDRILIVNVSIHGNVPVPTAVTYNGVAMTLGADEVYASDNCKIYQYYLIAPATGANNISVTFSGSSDYAIGGISLTGADQTSPIGANDGGTGTSSSPSNTITTTFANSIIISGVAFNGRSAGSCSATGTNQTTRYAIDNGTVNLEAGGSTQTTTTAGSYTSSWTGGSTGRNVQSLLEIKQVQPVASRRTLSLLGVS